MMRRPSPQRLQKAGRRRAGSRFIRAASAIGLRCAAASAAALRAKTKATIPDSAVATTASDPICLC